jgi:hypothetical protein
MSGGGVLYALLCIRASEERFLIGTSIAHTPVRSPDPVESTRALGAQKGTRMLWTIFVILLIMWLLGMVSGYTIGGFIHILLIIAIVVVLIRVIQGRSPV